MRVLSRRQSVKSGRGSSRDNAKLFNVDNNLELFKVVVKLIHRNRCITALRRKALAVELLHVYDQEVP